MQLGAQAGPYEDTLSCPKHPSSDYSNGKQGSKVIYYPQISFSEYVSLHRLLPRRSSDPASRRQSEPDEASGLTNNHYFFSGPGEAEEGKY